MLAPQKNMVQIHVSVRVYKWYVSIWALNFRPCLDAPEEIEIEAHQCTLWWALPDSPYRSRRGRCWTFRGPPGKTLRYIVPQGMYHSGYWPQVPVQTCGPMHQVKVEYQTEGLFFFKRPRNSFSSYRPCFDSQEANEESTMIWVCNILLLNLYNLFSLTYFNWL